MMSFEYVTTSLVQPRTVLESVKITSQETITLPPCTLFILSTHLYKLPIIFPYLHHKPIYSLQRFGRGKQRNEASFILKKRTWKQKQWRLSYDLEVILDK